MPERVATVNWTRPFLCGALILKAITPLREKQGLAKPRGPQQAEILDADAEIRAEILLESEIRNPKQYIYSDYFRKIPIISVKYGNNPIDPIEIP